MTVTQREYLRNRIEEIGRKKINAILDKKGEVPTLQELLFQKGKLYDMITLKRNLIKAGSDTYYMNVYSTAFKNFKELEDERSMLIKQRENDPKILAIKEKMKQLEDAAMFLKEPEVMNMLKEFEQN
jgi:hypothetical protein